MKNLQQKFDELIDSFILQKVGICPHFLDEDLAQKLKQNLLHHFQKKEMKKAGIGNSTEFQKDILFRNDSIFWLDKKNNNQTELDFFTLMDAFVLYLNSTCYTSITNYEFHYTLYEDGNYYKKHLDQFKSNDNRQFSMIMYLNENWKTADGGELLIYQETGNQKIAPQNRTSVFFKSNELEHEVLITKKARMSITGWLKTNKV